MQITTCEQAFRELRNKSEWTVGAARDEVNFTDEEFEDLKGCLRIKDIKDMEGKPCGERPLIITTSGDTVNSFVVDFSLLQKILYEHRRYAVAEGFSDAEMDVLRAIEFHPADRVGVGEIMDHQHAKEYSESTVYRYLRKLRKKGLIEKVRSGVYRYDGP
jgi:DNA-binding transcriptional ArsR family regulator